MRRAGLRIVTDDDDDNNNHNSDSEGSHHCSLCRFQSFNSYTCGHSGMAKQLPPLPLASPESTRRVSPSGYSKYFYDTNFSSTNYDSDVSSRRGSTSASSTASSDDYNDDSDNGIVPRPLRSRPRRHPLRRKPSPTTVTLRELMERDSQSVLLRSLRSDEELQRVYENQIMAYLDSPLSEFSPFV